jgi:phosphoribosylformylglycinamidine cyclo-ligase
MGIGLVIVVAEYYAEAIVRQLSHRLGIPAWIIGEVTSGEKVVSWQ